LTEVLEFEAARLEVSKQKLFCFDALPLEIMAKNDGLYC